MSSEYPDYRELARKGLLHYFAARTGLYVALHERRRGRILTTTLDPLPGLLAPYCQFIQGLYRGEHMCSADQEKMAEEVFETGRRAERLCHAGLLCCAIPVGVRLEVKGVLSYCGFRVSDAAFQQQAPRRVSETKARLLLTGASEAELWKRYYDVVERSRKDLGEFAAKLPRADVWFLYLISEDEKPRLDLENVRHDLQMRIQGLMGETENLFLRLQKEPDLDPKVKERAGMVCHAVSALDTVVQTLGDFAGEYHFEPRPIYPLLAEAGRIYEAEASRKGVSIRIEGPAVPRWPRLEISVRHLQIALNNLVQNAVKFSPRGSAQKPSLVSIRGTHDVGGFWITVENYGVGILPEEIEEGLIFQDGYQGKLANGAYRTGSGKGLSFVKQIITRHHGRIKVTSEVVAEGAGESQNYKSPLHLNRFAVYLPFRQPLEEAENG